LNNYALIQGSLRYNGGERDKPVNGTPTLFVNEQGYDGPADPESLLVALRQQALSGR